MLKRVAVLEARLVVTAAELAAARVTIAAHEQTIALREARIGELEAQVAELTVEWQRRKKGFRPKANAISRTKKDRDGRTKGVRTHPGVVRPPVAPRPDDIVQDVRVEVCPDCGGAWEDTGEFVEPVVEDLPPPQVEVRRVRCHRQRCRCCRKVTPPATAPAMSEAYVGPRARLLMAYCRAELGLSLGKSVTLLAQRFGLSLSRTGALGHIHWAADLVDPVVRRLFELLKTEAVVHAEETGWRDHRNGGAPGQNVWRWCFCNPRLALFLCDEHRSGEVVKRVLGESMPGVLVTDFYAASHALDGGKPKCLVPLLRELHTLRDDVPSAAKAEDIPPLRTLLPDAIALGRERGALTDAAFSAARTSIHKRLDALVFSRPQEKDCARINRRLVKHRFDLRLFLERSDVPPDNNLGERDIRSVAATRADGGVNRTKSGAEAFAKRKSIARTCRKHGRNFLEYAQSLIGLDEKPPPLPFAVTATPALNTS